MGGSLDRDVNSPPFLTAELVGGGSIPNADASRLNKVTFLLFIFIGFHVCCLFIPWIDSTLNSSLDSEIQTSTVCKERNKSKIQVVGKINVFPLVDGICT